MHETRLMMGMPITVDIPAAVSHDIIDAVFEHFNAVDLRFSTYKPDSEVSRLNRGEIGLSALSEQMLEVLALVEETRKQTMGYFDLRRPDGSIDPSGIVKGWSILKAAEIVQHAGYADFYVDAGGDIQTAGHNADGEPWRVGVRSPFNPQEIVKVLALSGQGIATSGTYVRGHHIYNPLKASDQIVDVVSLTVIAKDVLEADRFATAAFAMGQAGIEFIEDCDGLEGYSITPDGMATLTTGFEAFAL
ncbi:MAG TPA: FAD:protein FMN transferase [Devosiaceae bacterium]